MGTFATSDSETRSRNLTTLLLQQTVTTTDPHERPQTVTLPAAAPIKPRGPLNATRKPESLDAVQGHSLHEKEDGFNAHSVFNY